MRLKHTKFCLPELLPLVIDIKSRDHRDSSHLRVPRGDVLLKLRFALQPPKEFPSYSRPAFHVYLVCFLSDRMVGGWFLDAEQNGSSLFLVMYFDFVLVRELCC